MSASPTQSDFTGIWKVDLEKSVLSGPPIAQILVRIEHHEPALTQEILTTGADGVERRLKAMYEIGVETTNSINGAAARSIARWEGTELVIATSMIVAGREVYFRDHWSLSDGGQALTMAHRDDALAGQIAILSPASQGEASKFEPPTPGI